MHGIELVVALLLASTVLAGIARAINVHYAIVLVLGGLVVGLVSGTSAPRVDPDVVLFVFLPPLVYAASFGSSTQDLRAHAQAIGLLAVGLVLVTMGAVAVVAHAVAHIGWGPALVLGAILGPTDPIAATSVLRRLGAPDRISTILEGEALVNDGTGLTVYKLAVAAVVSGHFSPGLGIVKFIGVSAGGVAIGLAAGWLSVEVRKRIDEPQMEISISLLTAYLAYLPADRVGASGVLAALAAGLYTGGRAGLMLSPTSRLRTLGFWEALTFLLESVLFLLIGLQLPHVTQGLSVGTPLLYAAAVAATLVAVRVAWMFSVPQLVRVAVPRWGETEPGVAERTVLGWSGMRGGVSLAAALAVPLTARGTRVPRPCGRDLHRVHHDRRDARHPRPDPIPADSPARARRRGSGRPRGGAGTRPARARRAQANRRPGCLRAATGSTPGPAALQIRATDQPPRARRRRACRRRRRRPRRPTAPRAQTRADRCRAPTAHRPAPARRDLSRDAKADRARTRPRRIQAGSVTPIQTGWLRLALLGQRDADRSDGSDLTSSHLSIPVTSNRRCTQGGPCTITRR